MAKRVMGPLALLLAIPLGCSQDEPSKPSGETKPGDAAIAKANPAEDRLHQPFEKAIRPEPPAFARPPDLTVTGKSTGKLYSEVERLWPTIRFNDERGRKLGYKAIVDTDLGTIEIELLPEVAPNHVRSFVALAKAGYYDGLLFETRTGDPQKVDKDSPRAVAGGSPEGDGNDIGSIGYWLLPEILLPEFAEKQGIKHMPGTVGAVHGFQQLDAAGCRFYISLTDAPQWDGEFTIFGRVTRGLEVAQKIFDEPVKSGEGSPLPFSNPPKIRKVTITMQPLEAVAAGRK